VTAFAALLVLAFCAGLGGAILGLGGGLLIVPVVTLFFHIPLRVAIGASLISVVATSAGASVAFVRDGWTNLRVAMTLEVATVTGSLLGSSVAGLVSPKALYLLFSLGLVLSGYGMVRRRRGGDQPVESDRLGRLLRLEGTYPSPTGEPIRYGVIRVPLGAVMMVAAGVLSGLLGIGAGALKVPAMDVAMRLPMKVSSATSNFMIGVTAGAGALVYMARGDVVPEVAAPIALGVTAGATLGSRLLPGMDTTRVRRAFVVVLGLIAVQMAWKALSGGAR
jgi:uncharacterized membrane protein YfcA